MLEVINRGILQQDASETKIKFISFKEKDLTLPAQSS